MVEQADQRDPKPRGNWPARRKSTRTTSLRHFGEFAALGLSIASGTLAVAAALLAILRTRRAAVYVIAALAVVEVFVLASLSRDTFALSQAYSGRCR